MRMSHNYLLELHELIDLTIKEAQALNDGNGDESAFINGRIAALEEFKVFISGMFNHKLPKRLLKRLNEKKTAGEYCLPELSLKE